MRQDILGARFHDSPVLIKGPNCHHLYLYDNIDKHNHRERILHRRKAAHPYKYVHHNTDDRRLPWCFDGRNAAVQRRPHVLPTMEH